MKARIIIMLILFLLNAHAKVSAQETKKDSSGIHSIQYSGWYHHGYLFPHHRLMAFYSTDYINGYEISTSGIIPRINTYRPTKFGMGYYFSNLGNREVFGRVYGVYGSITADFCKSRLPFYFQQTTAAGVSYITRHFDITENHSNRVIGSHLNAFAMISVDIVTEFDDKLALHAGPSAVHMSNGNIKTPNLGLNLFNARFGITYKLKPQENSNIVAYEETEAIKRNSIQLIASGSVRQLSRYTPENFFVGSFLFEYSRRINPFQSIGCGVDFFIDPTIRREIYILEDQLDKLVPWHVGIHASWERIWNKFSIVLQPGYKIIRPSKHDIKHFYRAGVRYTFENNIILSCAIKAHKFKGDFFEYGAGYRF